jgi:hypothetical protein
MPEVSAKTQLKAFRLNLEIQVQELSCIKPEGFTLFCHFSHWPQPQPAWAFI